jgi:hypothetical protein
MIRIGFLALYLVASAVALLLRTVILSLRLVRGVAALSLLCVFVSSARAQTPKVEYSFTATKVGTTTPATAFKVGDEIDVVLYVRDLRPAGTWYGTKLINGVNVTKTWPLARGVFAAYADVPFDPTVLSLESVAVNTTYKDGQRFVSVGNMLDDTGAFTEAMGGLGTGKRELLRFRFKCFWGDTTLQCYFDSIKSPEYDTLVYGNDAAQPPEPSYVGPSEITVIPVAVTVR